MQGKSCLTGLMSFDDKVTCRVDKGKVVDVEFFYFSKAFDTVSHSKLLDKISSMQRDMYGCGLVGMVVLGAWLDSIILEVFSKL